MMGRTEDRRKGVRVSKEKVVEHRRAILETASRMFRERGFSEVGVAEIMQASGLTHGAFYGHFQSKADLAGEACRAACANGREKWESRADLSALVDNYLSPAHRDNPASGCAISAFTGEIAHQPLELQRDYADGVATFLAQIEGRLKIEGPADRRATAIAVLSSIVGALTLARSTAAGAPELSAELLQNMRAQLRERFDI